MHYNNVLKSLNQTKIAKLPKHTAIFTYYYSPKRKPHPTVTIIISGDRSSFTPHVNPLVAFSGRPDLGRPPRYYNGAETRFQRGRIIIIIIIMKIRLPDRWRYKIYMITYLRVYYYHYNITYGKYFVGTSGGGEGHLDVSTIYIILCAGTAQRPSRLNVETVCVHNIMIMRLWVCG